MHTYANKGVIYNVESLFSYANKLAVKNISLEDLKAKLYEKCWNDEKLEDNFEGDMSPIEAYERRGEGRKYEYHYIKAVNSDLSYPIILWQGKVVDGVHRLLKSYIEGNKTIKAVEFVILPEESVIKRKPAVLIIEESIENQNLFPVESQKFYDEVIEFLEKKGFYVHMHLHGDEEFWKNCNFVLVHSNDEKALSIVNNLPKLLLIEEDVRNQFNFTKRKKLFVEELILSLDSIR